MTDCDFQKLKIKMILFFNIIEISAPYGKADNLSVKLKEKLKNP